MLSRVAVGPLCELFSGHEGLSSASDSHVGCCVALRVSALQQGLLLSPSQGCVRHQQAAAWVTALRESPYTGLSEETLLEGVMLCRCSGELAGHRDQVQTFGSPRRLWCLLSSGSQLSYLNPCRPVASYLDAAAVQGLKQIHQQVCAQPAGVPLSAGPLVPGTVPCPYKPSPLCSPDGSPRE